MNIHDDVLDALRAELAGVTVSADFATKVRTQVLAEAQEDGLDALSRELSGVSVSPEFAARVRMGIDNSPARSRWFGFLNWRWAVPVAAAAVAVAAFALTRSWDAGMPGVNPASVTVRGPESPTPQLPRTPETPSLVPQATLPIQNSPAAATVRTAAPSAASGQQVEDKLEVITNQAAILRQLWAAATETTVVQVGDLPADVREIAITSVEVTPVAVQWLVEPLPARGAAPIIRRVSADAERSDK